MKALALPLWLVFLSIATLVLGTDEFVISGVLPAVAQDLSVSNGTAGFLVSAFALAFCLGSPVLAFVTDAREKRSVLVGALIVFAAANAGLAWAPNFALAIAMRIGAGLAAAAISPLCMVIAANSAPDAARGRYLALVTSGLTVALFSGVPLGAWLADRYSWRATFALIALVSLVVAVCVLVLAPSVAPGARLTISERLSPFSNRAVRRLVLAMFLCGAGGLMFYNYLGTIVLEALGGTHDLVVSSLLLVGLVGVLAVLLSGCAVDRFGPRTARLLIVGGHALALLALGVHIAVVHRSDALFFALIGFWSLFAWALGPAMQASLMRAAGPQAMLAMSLGISGLYGGSAAGAAIGGYLIDTTAASALPIAAAVFVACAFLLLGFGAQKRRCAHGPPLPHPGCAAPAK